MNITMLSNTLAGQPWQAGNRTALLSGINVFEGCATSIESNCTIHPATSGSSPLPCVTRAPEVLLNQVNIMACVLIIKWSY
jgi:hypothetical protein